MSFRSHKISILVGTFVAIAALGGLVFMSVKSSKDEDIVNKAEQAKVDSIEKLMKNPKALTKQDREDIRQKWDSLSPQTREKLMSASVQREIERFREEAAKLSKEERVKKIWSMVEKMRKNRDKLTAQRKERAQAFLSEMDVRKVVKNSMAIYQQTMTAEERAELDPLVHEYVKQMNEIVR